MVTAIIQVTCLIIICILLSIFASKWNFDPCPQCGFYHNIFSDGNETKFIATIKVPADETRSDIESPIDIDDAIKRFDVVSESMYNLAPHMTKRDNIKGSQYPHDWSTLVRYHCHILDLLDKIESDITDDVTDELRRLDANLRALEEIHTRLTVSATTSMS